MRIEQEDEDKISNKQDPLFDSIDIRTDKVNSGISSPRCKPPGTQETKIIRRNVQNDNIGNSDNN